MSNVWPFSTACRYRIASFKTACSRPDSMSDKRSGAGQNAGRAQRGERRGAQTVCRHVGDDPPDFSEHPSGSVIPRIEAPEHVCQLCKDNTGMIGEAHRFQPIVAARSEASIRSP